MNTRKHVYDKHWTISRTIGYHLGCFDRFQATVLSLLRHKCLILHKLPVSLFILNIDFTLRLTDRKIGLDTVLPSSRPVEMPSYLNVVMVVARTQDKTSGWRSAPYHYHWLHQRWYYSNMDGYRFIRNESFADIIVVRQHRSPARHMHSKDGWSESLRLLDLPVTLGTIE